jgi:hypothetical protein
MPPVHAILITHTPDRLRRTILGVAWSSRVPDSLTLACDADDPAIEAGLPLTLVTRPNAGIGRASQTRNNGVRALLRGKPDPASVLVFLDGDCVPLHDAIARHADALDGTRCALSLGWRYDLTEAQDAAFDEPALRRGAMPFEPTPDQVRALNKRHARFRRQRLQRALGFTKPHKPKLLSANFACTLEAYRRVNGFDEAFEGWGQEDDDFGKRLYQAGVRVHLGIRDILACHQFHVTRAPGDWADSPNARMLRDDRPTACELGLDSPAEQPEPAITRIEP